MALDHGSDPSLSIKRKILGMSQFIATCPCGQRLKVPASVESANCPSCGKLLRLKRTSSSTSTARPSQTRTASQRNAASLPASGTATRLRCPCGHVVQLPAGASTVSCGACGTALRAAGRSTQQANATPQGENRPASPSKSSPSKSLASTLPQAGGLPADLDLPPTLSAHPSTANPSLRSTTSYVRPVKANARRRPAASRSVKSGRLPAWLLPVAIGVGSLGVLGAVAAVVFPRLLQDTNDTVTAQDPSASPDRGELQDVGETTPANRSLANSREDSQLIRIGTYPDGPRLPGTTEFLEREFIESLPRPIGEFIESVPPARNAAPLYLEAVKSLADSIAVCFPESESAKLKEIGRQNKERIEGWYTAYESSQALPDERELKAFDSVYKGLALAQRKPECSYLVVNDLRTLSPEVPVLRVLVRLTILRAAAAADSQRVQSTLDELRIVLRYLREIGHHSTVGQVSTLSSERFLLERELPLLIQRSEFDADDARSLLRVLEEHAEHTSFDWFISAERSEQLMFHRFLFQLENDPEAVSSLISAMTFGAGAKTEADQNRFNMIRLLLARMTKEQIGQNRTEYDEAQEMVINYLRNRHDDWWTPLKKLEATLAARADEISATTRQMLSGQLSDQDELNSMPWLANLFYPASLYNVRQLIDMIAFRRVAIAQISAILWTKTRNDPPSDVKAILEHAQTDSSPIDPFTGKLLKRIVNEGVPLIYSVGNDLRDDRAVSVSQSSTTPGDVYLRLTTP